MENKPGPPSPSSSTSTDQSQNSYENLSSTNLSRATKNWRKIKEISGKDDKRPPWRMVSLSTLPKADKNAILRAKLLDASRRMRAGKVAVGVQTDTIPTKICKEVNIEIQSDLIEKRDAENLTDGTITLKPDGPVILTYSISQMTDENETKNIQTQTATPSTPHKFFETYFNKEILQFTNPDFQDMDFTKSELKLLNQIKEIKLIDKEIQKTSSKLNDLNKNENLNDSSLPASSSSSSSSSLLNLSIDSLFDENKVAENYSIISGIKSSRSCHSTDSLWNFDYDEEYCKQNQRYNTPLNRKIIFDKFYNSFKNDSVPLKYTKNMKLLPSSERKSLFKEKKLNLWSIEQQSAISDLCNETLSLLNIFKQMSIMLGPDIELNDVPKDYEVKIDFISDYWYPILQDSARILDQKLSTLKNIHSKPVTPLDMNLLQEMI